MAGFPATHVAQIDAAIQAGRGAAASVLGQPYDIRRLGSATTGSITSATPVITAFPARINRTTSRITIENQTFDLLVYEAICDRRPLQIGDLLTETGYESNAASYYVAQARPTRATLLARAESSVTITRPKPSAGRASQQPASGAVSVAGYAGITKASEQVLTLTNGLYSFIEAGSPGTPAVVPCGLQPLNRVRDAKAPNLPTALYREHFLMYVPDLPGVMLNELDRFNFPNSDRYEVALYFTTEQTGFTGHVCVVEKTTV